MVSLCRPDDGASGGPIPASDVACYRLWIYIVAAALKGNGSLEALDRDAEYAGHGGDCLPCSNLCCFSIRGWLVWVLIFGAASGCRCYRDLGMGSSGSGICMDAWCWLDVFSVATGSWVIGMMESFGRPNRGMLAVTCRWVLTPILNVFETCCPIVDCCLEMKLPFAKKMGC
ncbi:hypothetical protein ACLOJK_006583 [Asimina triloba]